MIGVVILNILVGLSAIWVIGLIGWILFTS